jgi:hypothetical protein
MASLVPQVAEMTLPFRDCVVLLLGGYLQQPEDARISLKLLVLRSLSHMC